MSKKHPASSRKRVTKSSPFSPLAKRLGLFVLFFGLVGSAFSYSIKSRGDVLGTQRMALTNTYTTPRPTPTCARGTVRNSAGNCVLIGGAGGGTVAPTVTRIPTPTCARGEVRNANGNCVDLGNAGGGTVAPTVTRIPTPTCVAGSVRNTAGTCVPLGNAGGGTVAPTVTRIPTPTCVAGSVRNTAGTCVPLGTAGAGVCLRCFENRCLTWDNTLQFPGDGSCAMSPTPRPITPTLTPTPTSIPDGQRRLCCASIKDNLSCVRVTGNYTSECSKNSLGGGRTMFTCPTGTGFVTDPSTGNICNSRGGSGRPIYLPSAQNPTPAPRTQNGKCAQKYSGLFSTWYDQEVQSQVTPCDANEWQKGTYSYYVGTTKKTGYCCVSTDNMMNREDRTVCQLGRISDLSTGRVFTSEEVSRITCDTSCAGSTSNITYGDKQTTKICTLQEYSSSSPNGFRNLTGVGQCCLH